MNIMVGGIRLLGIECLNGVIGVYVLVVFEGV